MANKDNKNLTINKGIELLRRLMLTKTFNKEIKNIRGKFLIPEEGFNYCIEAYEFLEKLKISFYEIGYIYSNKLEKTSELVSYKDQVSKYEDFQNEIMYLMSEKENLNPPMYDLIESYILIGEEPGFFISSDIDYYKCEIEICNKYYKNNIKQNHISDTEKKWLNSKDDFYKVYIPKYASQKEVISFLKDFYKTNAKEIKERIKPTKNYVRDNKIWEYYNMEESWLNFNSLKSFSNKLKIDIYTRIKKAMYKNENIDLDQDVIRKVIQNRREKLEI